MYHGAAEVAQHRGVQEHLVDAIEEHYLLENTHELLFVRGQRETSFRLRPEVGSSTQAGRRQGQGHEDDPGDDADQRGACLLAGQVEIASSPHPLAFLFGGTVLPGAVEGRRLAVLQRWAVLGRRPMR